MNPELSPCPSLTLPPVSRAESGKSAIVFCSQRYRRSGVFYENHRDAPDYETLAADGGARLYLVNPAPAARPFALTSAREDCRSCDWSPDGSRVAFDAAPCGKFDPNLSDGYYMGQRHLYVMDAVVDKHGNRHRRRLTHDNGEYSVPCWSPDGRFLLFQRRSGDRYSGDVLCCVVPMHSGRDLAAPHMLTPRASGAYDGRKIAAWSPDSRWIAVASGLYFDDPSFLRLYHVDHLRHTTPPIREIQGVRHFAWSPTGAALYLYRSDATGQILNVATGKSRRIAAIFNPVWLANGTIIGDVSRNGSGGCQIILSAADGSMRRREFQRGRSLDRFPHRSEDGTIDYCEERTWHPVPQQPERFVLTTRTGMSDGQHETCYLVDARRGTYHRLRSGHFFGFSPDGRRFLRADYEWVGPYKRGGERVGALECVSTLDGRSVATLTERLSRLSDVSWYGR